MPQRRVSIDHTRVYHVERSSIDVRLVFATYFTLDVNPTLVPTLRVGGVG